VLNVTHGFPHPGQIGGHRCHGSSVLSGRLIAAVARSITGSMFWTSPHARLLVLVVGSAVALALLALTSGRSARRAHDPSAATASVADATPGAHARDRRVYRISLQRASSNDAVAG
jgi:hypothetical protein